MVHGKYGVTVCDIVCTEYRIRGQRADKLHAFIAQRFQYRDKGIDFLMAEVSALAGMWVKPAHKYARFSDVES